MMQYYTRLFHDTRVPYDILDEEFTVYEEAEIYSEELYQRLMKRREEEMNKYDDHAFSVPATANMAHLFGKILERISHCDIADVRVFLLGGIAPSVMKRLREEQQKQDAEWAALRKKIEERQSLDEKRMPDHWLPLLEAEWFDGFVEWTTEGDRLLSAVARFSDRRICKIKFRNARIWKETEEERGTINLFAEVLWEDGKLCLNILTHTNEFSVLAEDVETEWSGEEMPDLKEHIKMIEEIGKGQQNADTKNQGE